MNPNPFGSPQGGAFQAPSGTMKPGLFQSFGQQTTGGQAQGMNFFQPSAFGQPSAMNQPAPHGATMFGQAPAFGQASSQLSMNQTPPFGQPSLGMNSSGFGSGATPAFGQTGGSNQSSMFGQAPAIGQTSAFGQVSPFGQPTPGFGSQPPAFGQQPTGFGNSQMTTGSSPALGQPQPLAFGQPVFGQPSATSAPTGMFGTAQTVTQTRGMGSEFSFKPATEAVFKPIFSASPEPSNPQTTSLSSSPFGSSGTQTSSGIMSSSTTTSSTGFSVLAGAKSGTLGFSFSQPAAAPSISVQSNPLTTSESSSPSKTLQFTFSQPAAPSSSSTKATTTEPTTPSSFSFTTKTLQSQSATLFGASGFGQPPGFSDTKTDAGTENKGGSLASLEESNVFARLSKAPKRKEDSPVSGSEKPSAEEDDLTEGDSPRHPPKRPLRRSRGPPAGLFGRALSGLRKEGTNPARREVAKESQAPAPQWEEPEKEAAPAQEEGTNVTPLVAQRLGKEAEEKVEESEPAEASEPKVEVATPDRLRTRTESTDSLSGVSPSDLTTVQCRNVPPTFNKRDVIEKHFSHFGKVSKVLCRPSKNYALVYFDDHASAAKAKKKGKFLHGHDLLIVWQKKKQSPAKKELRPGEEKEQMEEQKQEDAEPVAASSPLKRPPTLRPSLLDDPVAFTRSSPVKKSYQVKSLQFDPEPQKDSGAVPESSERPTPSSVHYLIGQVAESAEDKFRLLEQRDKVLRQGRPKRTNLDMSKVFVGTCPDMCPEKERYMRETRKQLSMYEVIPRTEMVDHAAAIKEYSRSSADQEEPLPLELRPLPVLSMTMDYLVTRIMDQGHNNYRDWYDFVWNRTRGIRKDITQQRLCCPHTVSLIEKCTRFHVHCAHHLCEEQMSSFDAKINNENMTKCLQSLKEMYEDLDMRQVYCPHEAEFRQYNVLLKLNEGDILREVQQFRDVVRNSPEVKFAVQAFAAVNSNNFVRFFKLVKKASYLASCLLHRYFNQVRAKALKTLNMAHAVGLRSTAFPVEDIVRMLMFRDASEATDFIQQYGLNVNDGMVELSRLSYQEPELPLSQKKSEVILAKKMVLIGEVVNGGPLPSPPQHVPVCSFDSQNKYKGEVPLAEPAPSAFKAAAERVEVTGPPSEEAMSQVVSVRAAGAPPPYVPLPAVTEETGEPALVGQPPAPPAEALQLLQPIAQPQPVTTPPPPPKPQPVYTDEDIMAELDGVIGEVLDVAVREVADAAASYTTAALAESSVQVDSLVAEVLGQLLQEVSSSEIQLEQERLAEEKRRLEEAQRKKEREAFLVEFGFSLCTKIVDEVLNETIQETATLEIQLAVDEKAERVAKCTEEVCSNLIEDTLKADISVLVEGLLEAELQLIHKYIKRWRDVVAVRRQLKRQMRSFPAAPCCVDPRFKLKALAPSAPAQPSMQDLAQGFVNLGNTGMLALSSTSLLKMRQASIRQMRVHYYYQRLLEETVWAPLDLPALLTENIPNPPERIFWKAVLLLPSNHETVASLADRILSDWLEVKFSGEKTPESLKEQEDGTLQTMCVTNTLQERAQRTHKVHISVKASRGPLTEAGLSKMEESCELQGAGALVMLLPALPAAEPGQDEQDVPLLSALLQLKQLQQATTWHCPLPLVVLVPGSDGGAVERQRLEEALMLDTLLKEGLISEYTFFFIPETTNDLQGTKQLSQALTWLLPRAPPPFPLTCQTLLQLIDSSLTHTFIPRVAANCQERLEACLPSQDPAPIILLYNALLAHIAEKVSSEELCKLSWPPGEFCMPETLKFVPPLGWNSADQLGWLHETILSLQLPTWEPSSDMDSWSQACTSIYNYAARLKVSDRSQLLLVSQLDNLLERVRLNIWHTQTPSSQATKRKSGSRGNSMRAACSGIPWDDVLAIFIEHKLKDWCPAQPPVCEDALTEDGDVLVYFLPDALKEFQPPEEWIQAVQKTHQEKQQETDRTNAAASFAPSSQSLRQRLFQSQLEPANAAAAPAPHLDITHTPTAEELLAHRVLQGLEEEKAESKRSMEQLQRWLDGEPLDHLSTPLFIPSSTLLSMPTTIRHPPAAKTQEASGTQEPEAHEQSEGGAYLKAPPDSMAQRLAELQRQILASHEEELACRLKLNALMSIVDD